MAEPVTKDQGASAGSGGAGGSKENTEVKPAIKESETLVIKGQNRELTRDEVIAAAQKYLAGEDALRLAAEKEKALGEATELYADIKKVRENQDMEAFRRVTTKLGADPVEVEKTIQQFRHGLATGGESHAEAGEGVTSEKKDKMKDFTLDDVTQAVVDRLQGGTSQAIGMDRLEPKLQKTIGKLTTVYIQGIVERALDTDPVLSKIVKSGTTEQKAVVHDMTFEELERRVQAGNDILAGQGLPEALQTVRAKLKALGVTGSGSTSQTGLGSAPGGSAASYQTTPLKRPVKGMADPAYGDWLVQEANRLIEEKQANMAARHG